MCVFAAVACCGCFAAANLPDNLQKSQVLKTAVESFHLGIKVSGVETQLRMGARGTSCPQTAPWFFEDNTVWTKATFFLLLPAGDRCSSGFRLSLGSVECMQACASVDVVFLFFFSFLEGRKGG